MAQYKVGLVVSYIYKRLLKRDYVSLTAFARDYNLDGERLKKYVRGEVRFDLHYFMALVEILELDLTEFYGLICQQDKDKGRI